MFNFKELKLDRRESADNLSSFVGIRRNNNELEFRLPVGFEAFPDNDFNATKQLFFRMYRTFKKFEKKFNENKSQLPLDKNSAGKDNIETKGNAYLFKDEEDNEVLLYSKISVIENLLEAYKDLALDVIERRVGRDEKIDYSKIDKYLHKAIYLPNDIIYLDEMDSPRHILHYDSATLVDLFCFILYELEIELERDSDVRVKDLANRFKEKYLSYEQSLFNEETFETTITVLKDILDEIDKTTAYKDEDYWRLYEAIESFLYGELDMQNTHEDGIFWGINKFSYIWEDMCSTYAFANTNFDVVYADTNIIFNGKHVANDKSTDCLIFKKLDFDNPFFIEFRNKKRWIRPDLVYFDARVKEDIEFDKAIKINILIDKETTLDFEIKLVEEKYKARYESFCLSLANNKGNARQVSKSTFKNYSKIEFEKQKQLIQENNYDSKKYLLDCKYLLDWKYMDRLCFVNLNEKIKQDIKKQLCYELALRQYSFNSVIQSEFFIPYFYNTKNKIDENIGEFMDDKILYPSIRENDIKVFQANFVKIQEIYINHD
jgi:hypothetical protein